MNEKGQKKKCQHSVKSQPGNDGNMGSKPETISQKPIKQRIKTSQKIPLRN